ncbi:MAG TPA: hypothetical protein VK172_09400 [Lentimicrobium sp.]|nr:hypothetical protein [Lentimicrobium sp.]
MASTRKITILRYNLLGSEESQIEPTLFNEILFNEEGQEIERFNYDTDGELEEHITVTMENGLNVEEILETQGEVSEHTTRSYDEKGRVVAETRHYAEGGSDIVSYVYDGDRLMLKHVIDPDGEEGEKEEWEYEGDKIIRESKHSMFGDIESEKSYDYDENGLLSAITELIYRDETPEKTILFFDPQGRLETEKKYDAKGRLIARTKVEYSENGKPLSFEEETTRGTKITKLQYDEKGNNIAQEETDQDGNRLTSIERSFDDQGRISMVEIVMEPSLYQSGQHYKLEYRYE